MDGLFRLSAHGFEHAAIVAAQAQQHFARLGLHEAVDADAASIAPFAAHERKTLRGNRRRRGQHGVDAVVAVRQPAAFSARVAVAAAVAPQQGKGVGAVARERKTFLAAIVLPARCQARQAQGAAAVVEQHDAGFAQRQAGGVGRGPARAQQAPVFAFGAGAVAARPGDGNAAFEREIRLVQDFLARAEMHGLAALDGFFRGAAILGTAVGRRFRFRFLLAAALAVVTAVFWGRFVEFWGRLVRFLADQLVLDLVDGRRRFFAEKLAQYFSAGKLAEYCRLQYVAGDIHADVRGGIEQVRCLACQYVVGRLVEYRARGFHCRSTGNGRRAGNGACCRPRFHRGGNGGAHSRCRHANASHTQYGAACQDGAARVHQVFGCAMHFLGAMLLVVLCRLPYRRLQFLEHGLGRLRTPLVNLAHGIARIHPYFAPHLHQAGAVGTVDGAGDLGVDLLADGAALDAARLAGRVALDGGNGAALVQDDGLAVRLDVGRGVLCFREFTDDAVGNWGRAGADGVLQMSGLRLTQ